MKIIPRAYPEKSFSKISTKGKKFLPILVLILVLNLIWEFSHTRLYNDLTGIPGTLHLVLASFVDVFLVSFIFLLISLKNKNNELLNKPKEKDFFFVVVIGLTLAFIWELINLQLGRWEYKSIMPLFFGVGLSPLLQLPVIGSLSLGINYCLRKFRILE